MTEPYLGEVRIFGFNFPPAGWAKCDGQLLSIEQNQALFSLLGTTYGGDGRTSFALPELRGAVPIHIGDSDPQGSYGGTESQTLEVGEMPSHNHTFKVANKTSSFRDPTGRVLSQSNQPLYQTNTAVSTHLNSGTVANAGSGAGHENVQPSLVVNICIALTGTYPPRN
ncbi:MAG: tail fiber protein [Chloroflexota bacterium]